VDRDRPPHPGRGEAVCGQCPLRPCRSKVPSSSGLLAVTAGAHWLRTRPSTTSGQPRDRKANEESFCSPVMRWWRSWSRSTGETDPCRQRMVGSSRWGSRRASASSGTGTLLVTRGSAKSKLARIIHTDGWQHCPNRCKTLGRQGFRACRRPKRRSSPRRRTPPGPTATPPPPSASGRHAPAARRRRPPTSAGGRHSSTVDGNQGGRASPRTGSGMASPALPCHARFPGSVGPRR
jgi:hypothetical protein